MKMPVIKIKQPIGEFFLGKLTATQIGAISDIRTLQSGKGIQRPLRREKINTIKRDCEDPDVVFPTSIILAIEQKNPKLECLDLEGDIWSFEFDETQKIADIIDGQHRIVGILEAIDSGFKDIEMPVVLIFNITKEEKAYVFATINSNQTKVDKSTIYALFSMTSTHNPFRTCHEIARAFNASKDSPFFNKLSMFGIREEKSETLTQGTFIDEILTLITRNTETAKRDTIDIKNGRFLKEDKNRPLRHYFIKNQDEYIYRILFNYFKAVSLIFREEWENSDQYILTKTTGFGALVSAFRSIYKLGMKDKDLSREFFFDVFRRIKVDFDQRKVQLTSDQYASGRQEQRKLRDEFLQSLKKDLSGLSEGLSAEKSKKCLTPLDLYYIVNAEALTKNPKAWWNYLDDEIEEHYSKLSEEDKHEFEGRMCDFVKQISDDLAALEDLDEADFNDKQFFIEERQNIIDMITDKAVQEFSDFVTEE